MRRRSPQSPRKAKSPTSPQTIAGSGADGPLLTGAILLATGFAVAASYVW